MPVGTVIAQSPGMALIASTLLLAVCMAPAPPVNWVLQEAQSSSSTRFFQVAQSDNNSDEPRKFSFLGQVLLTRKVWGNSSAKPPWTLPFMFLYDTPLGLDASGNVVVPPHTRYRRMAHIPRTTAFEVWADLDEVPTTLYRRDRIYEDVPSYVDEYTPLP